MTIKEALGGVVLGTAFFTMLGACSNLGTYSADVTVTSVVGEEITLTDAVGEEWVIDGDGFEVGDTAIAYFRDLDTPSRYDDQVYSVKVGGRAKHRHISTRQN